MMKCKTPGASFHCIVCRPNAVGETEVRFSIDIPAKIVISKTRAKTLERVFHRALESAMAPWWPNAATQAPPAPAAVSAITDETFDDCFRKVGLISYAYGSPQHLAMMRALCWEVLALRAPEGKE